MTVVRVKGFKIFEDRHGHERCYHRKTRIAIDLKKAPKGSPEFFAECARIVALTTTTADKPGTLGLLISAYRAHPAFTDLAPRTRSDYQNVFDYLKPIADTPLIKFDKPLIVQIRDKAAADKSRKFANDLRPGSQDCLAGDRSADISLPTLRPASRTSGAGRTRPPWP